MNRDTPAQAQGRDGNGKIVCIICNALYAAAPQEQATSSIALESAFLSMCHFCFRCRRPSCPQCWDEVHAICGACVKETGLAFRTAATPLSDPLFASVRQKQEREWRGQQRSQSSTQTGQERKPQSAGESKMPPPLVCLRPGQFSTLPIEAQATLPELPSIKETSPHLQAQRAPVPISPGRILNTDSPERPSGYAPLQMGNLLSLPSLPAPPALSHTPPTSLPAQRVPIPQPQQAEPSLIEAESSVHPPPSRRSGAMIMLIVLLVIVILAGVVVAALLSTQVNSFISQTVHIDIQAGIASLLRFFEQLRP